MSSDFSWLRTTRKPGRPPFLVTRHACFYDGTRGTEGTAAGLPVGLEGRGKVRVPATRGIGGRPRPATLCTQTATLICSPLLYLAGALRASRRGEGAVPQATGRGISRGACALY